MRPGRNARAWLVALFLLSLLLPVSPVIAPPHALAAPGDPVASFGTGGVVMTDFAGGNDSAQAITTSPFGRILVAGSATIPGQGTDFALAAYDDSGMLDWTFGANGRVTTDFFGADDGARGMVVQPDWKIVLSGFATSGSERQFALARFNPDGSLDPAFGEGGKVVLDLGSTSEAFKLALQPDLKIVAVGDSNQQGSLDFTVVRLNPDGSPDGSFGTNGVATVDFGNADRAIDVALDPDNIFVAGIAVKSATDSNFGIARLNVSDGSLNSDFDGDGRREVDFFGLRDGAQALSIQPRPANERVLLVGGFATETIDEDFAVASLDFAGSLVPTSDWTPIATFDFRDGRDLIFDYVTQPDGGYVAVGWAGDGASFDLGMLKWNSNGALDQEFGLEARYALDTASGGNNVAFDATLFGGTIVTAGTGLNPTTSNDDFVITQHENETFAEIIKRALAVPVLRGDTVTYSFEITNLMDKERAFLVTDRLPDGVTFEESQNPEWVPYFAGIARQLTVPAGQTVFIGLQVSANESGVLDNKANLLLLDDATLYASTFLGSSEVEFEVRGPEITDVEQKRKRLAVFGIFGSSPTTEARATGSQAGCPTILVDGRERKTRPAPENPTTVLVAKKGGKKISRGETVRIRVRLCNGIETDDFIYTRPRRTG